MNDTRSPHRYDVYGAVLASTVEFPELPAATDDRPARWDFSTVAELPEMASPVALGDDHIYGAVHARFFAHDEGHRVIVDDTGVFDIARDGHRLRWAERADAWPDFVRSHLTGRVIATALWLDGLLPLHGSAVETSDGVIGFLAPKGYGKSTLAMALTQAGARLVTDDTLPIELRESAGPSPVDSGDHVAADPRSASPLAFAWPGVHSVRLKDDSLRALANARPSVETHEGKQIVTDSRRSTYWTPCIRTVSRSMPSRCPRCSPRSVSSRT